MPRQKTVKVCINDSCWYYHNGCHQAKPNVIRRIQEDKEHIGQTVVLDERRYPEPITLSEMLRRLSK